VTSKGDWTTANILFDGIIRKWRQGESRSAIAGSVLEAVLAYEGFSSMEMKFVEAFARNVIDSIPLGSIYFGGSDPFLKQPCFIKDILHRVFVFPGLLEFRCASAGEF